MSALLNQSLGTVNGRAAIMIGYDQNDDSVQEFGYRQSAPQMMGSVPIGSPAYGDCPDALWSRSGLTNGGLANPVLTTPRWEWDWPPTGVSVRKKVIGVVQNASGTPIASATVYLFNTATNLLVDTQVSASDGSFTCGDPNAVNCFAVGYLIGSPDTSGTTIDELTGV